MNINQVVISGNIGSVDERATQSGAVVLNFTVAVNERVQDRNTGEWNDRPNWIPCVMFGKRAESLARFLDKGMKVSVAGKLRQTSYERDGQKRSKIEIIANELELPPKPKTDAREAPMPSQKQNKPTVEDALPWGEPTLYDEDLPF